MDALPAMMPAMPVSDVTTAPPASGAAADSGDSAGTPFDRVLARELEAKSDATPAAGDAATTPGTREGGPAPAVSPDPASLEWILAAQIAQQQQPVPEARTPAIAPAEVDGAAPALDGGATARDLRDRTESAAAARLKAEGGETSGSEHGSPSRPAGAEAFNLLPMASAPGDGRAHGLHDGLRFQDLRQDVLPADTRITEPSPAGLVALQAPASAPVTAATPAPSITVHAPVGSPTFAENLGEKLVVLVGQETRSAEIHINPPELGPVEIRIKLEAGEVHASFVSQHAEVRDAVESSFPKLREMLAASGLALGEATVSAESYAGREQAGQGMADGSRRGSRNPAREESEPMRAVSGLAGLARAASRLVDTYA